jgi:hypothetical protein
LNECHFFDFAKQDQKNGIHSLRLSQKTWPSVLPLLRGLGKGGGCLKRPLVADAAKKYFE